MADNWTIYIQFQGCYEFKAHQSVSLSTYPQFPNKKLELVACYDKTSYPSSWNHQSAQGNAWTHAQFIHTAETTKTPEKEFHEIMPIHLYTLQKNIHYTTN